MAKKMKTMDGNCAAAHCAYAFTEVASNLPHHPFVHNGRICRRVERERTQEHLRRKRLTLRNAV